MIGEQNVYHVRGKARVFTSEHDAIAAVKGQTDPPVRPGDVLKVESEVLAVTPSRSRPERGLVTLKSETKNQKGEVVQVFTVKLLVWRRPEYGF